MIGTRNSLVLQATQIFTKNPKSINDTEKEQLKQAVVQGSFDHFSSDMTTDSYELITNTNGHADHSATWFVLLWERLSNTHQFATENDTFKDELKDALINRFVTYIQERTTTGHLFGITLILEELLYPVPHENQKKYQRQRLNQSDRLDILRRLVNKLISKNLTEVLFNTVIPAIHAIHAHLSTSLEALGDWTIFLAQEKYHNNGFGTRFYNEYLETTNSDEKPPESLEILVDSSEEKSLQQSFSESIDTSEREEKLETADPISPISVELLKDWRSVNSNQEFDSVPKNNTKPTALEPLILEERLTNTETYEIFCPPPQEDSENFKSYIQALAYSSRKYEIYIGQFSQAIEIQLKNREPQTNEFTRLLIKPVLEIIVAILKYIETDECGNNNLVPYHNGLFDILYACSAVLENNEDLQQRVVNDAALLSDLGDIFVRMPAPTDDKRTKLSGLLATRKMANTTGEKAFSDMLVNKALERGVLYENTFAYWITQQPLTLVGLIKGTKVSGRVKHAIDEHFAASEPLDLSNLELELELDSESYFESYFFGLSLQISMWNALDTIETTENGRKKHPILIHNLQEAIRKLPILPEYGEYIQFDVSNDSFREYLIKKAGELDRYSEEDTLFLTRFKALVDIINTIVLFQKTNHIEQGQCTWFHDCLTTAAENYKGKSGLHDTMGKHIERIKQVPFFEVPAVFTAGEAGNYLRNLDQEKFNPVVAHQICALLDTPFIQEEFTRHFVNLTTKNRANVTFSDYLKEKARDGKLKHLNGIINLLILLMDENSNKPDGVFAWREKCNDIGRTTINEYITVSNLHSSNEPRIVTTQSSVFKVKVVDEYNPDPRGETEAVRLSGNSV